MVYKIQAIAYGICMEERDVQYFIVRIGRNRKKTLRDIVQAMAELVTMAEENFRYKKVSNIGEQIMNLRNAREF